MGTSNQRGRPEGGISVTESRKADIARLNYDKRSRNAAEMRSPETPLKCFNCRDFILEERRYPHLYPHAGVVVPGLFQIVSTFLLKFARRHCGAAQSTGQRNVNFNARWK